MSALTQAWRASSYLPVSFVRGAAHLGAQVAWIRRGKATVRLEDNLHRVTGLTGRPLRSLSRAALASTARYYAEVMTLPRATGEEIEARVRMVNEQDTLDVIKHEGRIVVALSHSGNWDLVGAYASRVIAPVTSVAEVLKPQQVFDEFVAFRASIGIEIFGHEGSTTFRRLIKQSRDVGGVLALVADRDQSGSGVQVSMWAHQVTVAPGPAALAVATASALVPLRVHYERLHGERRRRAGSRWGVVMDFGPMLRVPDVPREQQIAHLSQAWAASLADGVAAHPEDWHMLQRFGWVS